MFLMTSNANHQYVSQCTKDEAVRLKSYFGVKLHRNYAQFYTKFLVSFLHVGDLRGEYKRLSV